jgi:hypothetical protein
MAQIFISYRRDDVPGYVRALMLEMKNMVGSQQVFLDMEDIEAGSDFASIIEDALSHCEVLLAIVGPQWLTSTNHLEQRRLDDPNDFVRLEIATALRRNIPAIPVLIENAKMPSEDDLPSDLKPLARLQGVPLAHSHWDDDINRLFRAIECVTDEPKLSRLYSQTMTELNEGRWQDALRSFQAIESIRPGYRDVAERIYPLSELAHGIMRLGPAPRGWRNAVARCPVLSMIVVSIFPNCLAAVFNFKYNWEAIVVPMQHRVQQAESLFQISAAIVNGVGFTLGLALFAYLARPVSLVLREVAHGGPGGLENLKPARDRCLKLGHFAALIGVVLWAMAGPVYPLMIGTLELPDYVYFVASLALSGVIAATYPFLGVTWLCTHVLYLPLIQPGSTTAADETVLERVERWNWRYLLLAGSLPMLAITLGIVLNRSELAATYILLGALGLGGLGGFVLAIWLFKSIQNDLTVLKQAARQSSAKLKCRTPVPSSEPLTAT